MSVFVSGILGLIGILIILKVLNIAHIIEEGHIGLYSRGGALIEGYSEPGLYFMTPFITSLYQVQVTLQTDQVQNIPCGTASGVLVYFDKVEVVNRLNKDKAWETVKEYTVNYDQTWIFDKIHHEINQFCSKHTLHEVLIDKFDQLDDSLQESLQKGCEKYAPGIEIISVRVTKPKIPKSIAENYIQSEAEKTKLLIAKEQQKISQQKSDIQKNMDKMIAQSDSEISKITSETQLIEQQGEQQIAKIQDQINFEKQKVKAEAEHYREQKQIAINQKKLKSKFQDYTKAINLKNVKKTYFGQSISSYINENNILKQEGNFQPPRK